MFSDVVRGARERSVGARGGGGAAAGRRRKRGRREWKRTKRQGNWKFLLPLRFHFTPNHAAAVGEEEKEEEEAVGSIQRALMRFATETSLSSSQRVDILLSEED